MMLLRWSILLPCLSLASAKNIVMHKKPGDDITLRCSPEDCPEKIDGYVGMYLYYEFIEKEEVLFSRYNITSLEKIMPRERYRDRIQTNRSLNNHIITISKLSVNDSGLYFCLYKPTIKSEGVQCNAYTVFVRGETQCSQPENVLRTTADETSSPLVVIVIICAITTLVTIIFILLVVPRVKRWSVRRRMTTREQPVSNDYVYEVMTKNGFHPAAAPQHSPPSLYNLA